MFSSIKLQYARCINTEDDILKRHEWTFIISCFAGPMNSPTTGKDSLKYVTFIMKYEHELDLAIVHYFYLRGLRRDSGLCGELSVVWVSSWSLQGGGCAGLSLSESLCGATFKLQPHPASLRSGLWRDLPSLLGTVLKYQHYNWVTWSKIDEIQAILLSCLVSLVCVIPCQPESASRAGQRLVAAEDFLPLAPVRDQWRAESSQCGRVATLGHSHRKFHP